MSQGFVGVVLALTRSFASLKAPRAWVYVLGPALVALVLWLLLATYWLGAVIAWMIAWPPLSWLVGWDFPGLARFLAAVGAWLVMLALTYLTATVLAAIFVLPLLLAWLADTQYRDLARMGRDSAVASLANTLGAAVVYVAAWALTLPLWFVPGFGLVVPIVLLAMLNRRTFAFDALAAHASREEWRAIRTQHGHPLFMLGLILSLLAHVPVVGLLVPTLSVLAYVHYTLEALRRLRQGAVIVGEAVVIDDEGRLLEDHR